MSDSRPSVELVSLAEDLTVSDKTMNFGGKEMSVIDYIKSDDKYSQEAFDAIDPDEPLARVRFPWSDDPVDTAPSLLHPLPNGIEPKMTGYAARSADERWRDTERFDSLSELITFRCSMSNAMSQTNLGEGIRPRLSIAQVWRNRSTESRPTEPT